MTECKPSAEATDRNVYLTLYRVIDAPVEAVYAAWTEPDMLRRWLAPGNATVVRAVAEAAVGGTFLIEMRGADGRTWLACCSARGLRADRRDKLLKLLDTGGQNCTPNNSNDLHSHTTMNSLQ